MCRHGGHRPRPGSKTLCAESTACPMTGLHRVTHARLARGGMPPLPARPAAKQERIFTQMKSQMHAKHADGPEPGMVVHGGDRSDRIRGAAPCGGPCPICVFCVHLPASALNPCLLRRAPHAAATDPGTCAPARTPCTNSPACRRCAVQRAGGRQHRLRCQNPMHQFRRRPAGASSRRGGKTPCTSGAVARRRCPPSRPA